MGRTVVIAEKPSVGRDIARVLGCQSSEKAVLSGSAMWFPGRSGIW